MKIGLDSSCIVPLIATATPFHEGTWEAYEQLRAGGAEFVITHHALLESFSVLTRSPYPIRTTPREAEESLRVTFSGATLAGFAGGAAWAAIRQTISRGHYGGRVYDAAIALATFEAGARLLLTWNVDHFVSVAPAGLEVRAP